MGRVGRTRWRATASRGSRRPPASRCRTTTSLATHGVGHGRVARARRRGRPRLAPGTPRGDRGFPGPFGSNPIGAYTAVDRAVARRDRDASSSAARWTQPFSAGGRTPAPDRQRELPRPDERLHERLRPVGVRRRAAPTVRAQTDVDLAGRAGRLGRRRVPARAGDEHLHHRRLRRAGADPPLGRRACSPRRATSRPTPLTLTAACASSASSATRLGQNPDPFSPRPAFGADARDVGQPEGVGGVPAGGSRAGGTRAGRALHAAAGTGIRPPDAFEIAFTDNPALKPERSRSVEAGVDQALARERLVARRHGVLQPLRRPDRRRRPGDRGREPATAPTTSRTRASRGVELVGGRCATGWGSTRRASLHVPRHGDPRGRRRSAMAPPPFAVGDPLLRRPRHQGSLDLTYDARAR